MIPLWAMYEDYKRLGFDDDYKLKYSKLFCDTFATDVSNHKPKYIPSLVVDFIHYGKVR